MRNTDAQRGDGVFERSIEALRLLNAAGYGRGDPRRVLTLVHNPAGAYLPAGQKSLEAEWKASLARQFGITFDRLIALNNMPIGRYLDWLVESGNFESYMERLAAAFNPAAVAGLMCRNTISIGWDGASSTATSTRCSSSTRRLPPRAAPTSRTSSTRRSPRAESSRAVIVSGARRERAALAAGRTT
jgi:hypothetical protein